MLVYDLVSQALASFAWRRRIRTFFDGAIIDMRYDCSK